MPDHHGDCGIDPVVVIADGRLAGRKTRAQDRRGASRSIDVFTQTQSWIGLRDDTANHRSGIATGIVAGDSLATATDGSAEFIRSLLSPTPYYR